MKTLSVTQQEELLRILQARFEAHRHRHPDLDWATLQSKLEAMPEKLGSLYEMEKTGGAPDVVAIDEKTGEYLFFDCAAESPSGRRSFCYDLEALESRKEHPPKNNVVDAAAVMGISLLSVAQYRFLQQFGSFDTKTSSWIQTPAEIRDLGGALYGDYRYGTVFIYHNGAASYYAARGFRGCLRV